MKRVAPSSLRPSALARLPSRLLFPTDSTASRRFTTCSSSILSTIDIPSMSTPSVNRKWPRRNGGNGGERRRGNATSALPGGLRNKRPNAVDLQPSPAEHVDVKNMYSTAAGEMAPKPFSDLKDKLNKGLLDGLDKMGFE